VKFRHGATGALACLLVLGVLAPAAQAQVQPYGTDNYGTFWDILPPGENGTDTLVQLAAYESVKKYPPYTDDQTAMYQNLLWGASTLTDSTIPDYFTDAIFGVKAGDIGSEESPEAGLTIVWDEQYGVPHIYGDTRPELMFGAGYAAAQDRLFEMDALRHIGRADVAQFAGGANANQDAYQWAIAPYTEPELNDQITALADSGPLGHQVYEDGVNYIAGINAYIKRVDANPTLLPAEYPLLSLKLEPFVPADLIAIASAIAGVEGDGGGTELQWTMLMEALQKRLGKRVGYQSMLDFHSIADPGAPTTIRGVRFPYDTVPSKIIPGSEAIPDPGSVISSPEQVKTEASSSGDEVRTQTSALTAVTEGERFAKFLPTGDSNALLVGAKDSSDGHPLAVMGPQLGYFSPELVFEEDLHGPGIDAEGAAIPGVSQYVELGHGPDYAWSATSGYEGVTSTFSVPLCNPSGGAVSIESNYYEFHGRCSAMDILKRTESWKPNLADSTPAGSQVLTAYRTAIGLVEARATIAHKPVAYVLDRSTYMHELDSAIGFMLFDEPAQMRGPIDFEHAAAHIGYTFNWLYVDSKNIAYFNSGLLPEHAAHTNPLFPTSSKYPWVDFNATNNTAKYAPAYIHPQVIDQPWMTSWNNLEAQGYSTTDSLTNFSSVWRVQLLSDGIKADLAHGHKMTLAQVIQVMENAGTIDLRGQAVLPYLLKVIGKPSNPALATAVSELRSWMDSGAHRFSLVAGGPYVDSAAIQTMDAWWPLLVKAIFEPVIGPAAYAQLQQIDPVDQPPNTQATSPGGGGEEHMGSAWDIGIYGTVQTDLEGVLGLHPNVALSRGYCGGGSLSRCRQVLETSLAAAIAEPATKVYPGYSGCAAGDQWCWDAITFEALGAIGQPKMQWVNRPTFQQAVEISSHQPYGPLPACDLREYPSITIASIRKLGRGGAQLTGTALPRDCDVPTARLSEVKVRIAGRWYRADGTRHWHLHIAGLAAGTYRVQARVNDVSGNATRTPARTITLS
jgi:acyl-homoserine lactone acylase PvdQ